MEFGIWSNNKIFNYSRYARSSEARHFQFLIFNLFYMAQQCELCERSKAYGNSRSHSNIASKRNFGINTQYKKINGKRMRICANCIKTLKRKKQNLDIFIIHYQLFVINYFNPGCSLTVRRMHGVHVTRVQFPAPRPPFAQVKDAF